LHVAIQKEFARFLEWRRHTIKPLPLNQVTNAEAGRGNENELLFQHCKTNVEGEWTECPYGGQSLNIRAKKPEYNPVSAYSRTLNRKKGLRLLNDFYDKSVVFCF